jgi:predicted metal-dependent peptidase
LLPDATRATARQVVAGVLADVERQLAERTRSAVHGALARSDRTRRPRPSDIDWGRTIHANLSRYVPEQRTVIPERLVGYGRRQRSLSRDVIIAVDQSGSMVDSLVYAAIFGAVLAGVPALSTKLITFDTSIADLSHLLHDPVDLLFGLQLGGGTDIASAIEYCAGQITRPADTVMVVVTDLFEGGNSQLLEQRVARLVQAGVTVVVLLALSDEGAPVFDHDQAARLASLGVASFACTPDQFPDLIAAALERRDLGRWAGEHGIVTAAPQYDPLP